MRSSECQEVGIGWHDLPRTRIHDRTSDRRVGAYQLGPDHPAGHRRPFDQFDSGQASRMLRVETHTLDTSIGTVRYPAEEQRS